jgi:hypothetical protein
MINVDQAQITRRSDGMVVVDDPHAPVIVAVQVKNVRGRSALVELHVQDRQTGRARISASLLSRLPVAQIVAVAAATQEGGHPDEVYYRQLARPKPRGRRASWDPGHWQRVMAVYEWAVRVRRPGGGTRAVADFWNVTIDPTVYRWLKTARGHQPPD